MGTFIFLSLAALEIFASKVLKRGDLFSKIFPLWGFIPLVKKNSFVSFLMFFGTLKCVESPYAIYFCSLGPFMLLRFIMKLAVQKNIPQQRAQQQVLLVLSPNIIQENLVFVFFSMVEKSVKPRITKFRKTLDKQDKIDVEKQTLSSGFQN